MAMKRSEATRTFTTYEVGVLGKNNCITSVRSVKAVPSPAELMEVLTEFNFMKIDQFMANEVIVIETTVTKREALVFTKPMDVIRSRVNDRRAGLTVRPRGEAATSKNAEGSKL